MSEGDPAADTEMPAERADEAPATAPRRQRARTPRVVAPSVPARSPSVEELDQSEIQSIIGYALRRAQVALYQDYARTVGDLGVRPAGYAALSLIVANPGLSQGVLSQAMGIDRSGAVALIDELESQGLAMRVRSPSDRRSYALMPTPAGQARFAELRERVHDSDARITGRLSVQERKTLIGLLRRIYE